MSTVARQNAVKFTAMLSFFSLMLSVNGYSSCLFNVIKKMKATN